MSEIETKKSIVTLYCCGGTGVNIGQQNTFADKGEVGFAYLSPVYIDTADVNDRKGLAKSDKFYNFEQLDGSGKIRAENKDEISGRIRDILQKFRPTNFNIVVSSGGGGSGSVIAPLITRELLTREVPVVVVLVGSVETRKDAENTLNTIKSYEVIAQRANAPVVMAYVENGPNTSRSSINAQVQEIILSLCVLFSRQNAELDSQDIYNWSRFNRVTSFAPQLAGLFIGKDWKDAVRRVEKLGKPENVITVATVAKDPDFERFDFMPEYHAVGFVPENGNLNVNERTPLHFFTADSFYNDVAERLSKMLKELSESQAARVNRRSIVTADDTPGGDDLIV